MNRRSLFQRLRVNPWLVVTLATLGTATALAVTAGSAWGLAAMADGEAMWEPSDSIGVEDTNLWHELAPCEFDGKLVFVSRVDSIIGDIVYMSADGRGPLAANELARDYGVHAVSVGLPFRAACGEICESRVLTEDETAAGGMRIVVDQKLKRMALPFGDEEWEFIPMRPTIGLVGNTIVFSLFLGGIWWLVGRTKRYYRGRSGRCGQCGHVLFGVKGQCPECGSAIPEAHGR